MNIVIIGIGGIGTHLLLPLLQFLKDKTFYEGIYLVDGDHFEEKNNARQFVPEIGRNKADVTSDFYLKTLNINTIPVPIYINEQNISTVIKDGDVVFLCVDNNKTRKLVDDHIQQLSNITLISGGNELYDGNVQVVQIKNGFPQTMSIQDVHPEISEPQDKSPEEMSCDELLNSQPQISVVNAGIADIMRRMFFGMVFDGIDYYETFVNFKNGNIRNIKNQENGKLELEVYI